MSVQKEGTTEISIGEMDLRTGNLEEIQGEMKGGEIPEMDSELRINGAGATKPMDLMGNVPGLKIEILDSSRGIPLQVKSEFRLSKIRPSGKRIEKKNTWRAHYQYWNS